ncbi:PP2C family serine/threonine-protein phosphatase [Bythopirellula polymerisocia]|uniref:PPM-type phosphatase domain-containing protein n=1 Tax=Bythopirellula polymerisocia TaxID=2528003 RepID=A0A5C6CZW4_9BACT|nr:PP2C family serine/threonine-protein phosphatase [Bythopirellula polymerisocia]TWU29475.1 hypothetical protein Pla144_02530 [Bythopirellula polymerisocia]
MASVWRPIFRSVQGASHLADEIPCQDNSRVRILDGKSDGTLVACVADGAGSAKHSAVGSLVACSAIVECIDAYMEKHGTIANVEESHILQWCEVARGRIEEEAKLRESLSAEFATTICAAILSPTGSCFFQIGDGAIVLEKAGICGVVFWPESGEYINTTTFLTSKEYRDRIQSYVTSDAFHNVALFTDGIERIALRFDTRTPHPPFFGPLFQALRTLPDWQSLGEKLEIFLRSSSVASRSDDDKTLLLASLTND